MSGDGFYNQLLQPDLRQMLAEDDETALHAFCDELYPVVVAEVLHGMDAESAWRVLRTCSIQRQAEIFEFIDPAQQLAMVKGVDRARLSRLIEVMSPDDRVDLLEHMDEEQLEALFPLIAQAERDEIKKMLSYPENSAGSIMTTEYASIPENITAREALDRLRQQAPDSETIYYIYVVDENRRLDGVITLRELILARPSVELSTIMRRDVVSARVTDDQQVAARQLARFDLLALPVLDEENRLVGIITHDDIIDVIQDEASEDAYLQSAIEPLEHSYFATPLLTIAWKRGVWLMVLSIVALVTAKLLRIFDPVRDKHMFLDWFLPLVLASGGNTGSQSATLVIRTMALTALTPKDNWRIVRRELITGVTLGLCLGLFGAVSATALFDRHVREAAVIAMTVSLVVTMGSVTGSVFPILFARLGMDPAIISNPLISSLSDILGVVVYCTVAMLFLEWLM